MEHKYYVLFRHTDSKNNRSMISLSVVDDVMGDIIFEKFREMGMHCKLMCTTDRSDLSFIIKEAN